MKPKFTRMKTRAKAVSSRSVALILCFVMLITAISAGSVMSVFAVKSGYATVEQADATAVDASEDVSADTAVDEADDAAPAAAKEDSDVALTAADADENENDYEFVYENPTEQPVVEEAPAAEDTDNTVSEEDASVDEDTEDEYEEEEPVLEQKGDLDLAETGDASVYGIKGSWDSWSNVTYFSGTTGSATATVSLTAGTTYTFKIYSSYGNCYYGANTTFTASTSSYYFNTSNGNASLTATYTNTYTFTLLREDQNDGAVNIAITFPTSGTSSSIPDLKIYGNYNSYTSWSTSNINSMNYVGTDGTYYYYTYVLSNSSSKDHYFRFKEGSYYYCAPNDSSDVNVSNDRTSLYNNYGYSWRESSDAHKAFKIGKSSYYKILWAKYQDEDHVESWYVERPTVYLTGYINGADYSGTNHTFGSVSGNTVTYTLTSTTASQYVTITNYNSTSSNKDTYHPAVHASGSGVSAAPGNTDRSPTADNKWLVTGVANKSVTFTWNFLTNTLSWVVNGNNVTVYAKDGCAPINWDCTTSSSAQKEGPGATGFSGYYYNNYTHYLYNYAAIATTTMTNGDGTAISGITTSSCDINGSTSYTGISQFKTATLVAGTKIKITTTIGTTVSSWRTRYYVKGWCINGVTYKCGDNIKGVNTGTGDGTSGAYTMYYTIPSSADAGEKFEITPIYYFADDSNCITFYLEGFDKTLQDAGWGSTPYAFPFYGNLSGYQDSFGVYPGQPMVYVNGKYSMEIPITSVGIYSSTNDGTIIKGVTVSNGYADHVHRNLVYDWNTKSDDIDNDETHTQTYDFDDFYKIYNEKRDSQGNRPNAIIMRMKRETTRYNRNVYGDAYNYGTSSYINWGFSKNDPYTTLYGTNYISTVQYVKNIAASGNGWELLTDRYGRPVDLFGNVIGTTYDASAETSKPAIRVISTGYNENLAGDYGTGWLIYTPTGADGSTYSTAITNADGTSAGYIGTSGYTLQTATGGTATRKAVIPSIFLLNSADSFNTTTYPNVTSRSFDGVTYSDTINNYKNLYNTLKTSGTAGTNAVGRYVYITYESDQQRKGKTNSSSDTNAYGAKRLDARWYYTYATDMVSATIKVQVWNTSTNQFEDVAFKTDNSGYNSKNNNTVSSTVSGKSTENLKAYFTNASFDGEVESGNVLINSGDFEFKAVTNGQWVFDSWQIEYDGDTYTELSTSASASTPMSATDVLVARFMPLTTGNLALSHHLSSDSTGSGTTQINVQVFSNNTKSDLLYESGLTTDDVTLDSSYISNGLTDLYIYVTLTTTPSGDDKINQMSGPSSTFFGGTTPKSITAQNAAYTYAFGFTVGSLYSGSTQTTLSLPYYSRVIIQNHYYTFTYTFPKRDGTSGSYTAKGTFTAKEYETYVSGDHVLSGSFVKAKAPFESNFNKTMTLSYNDTYPKSSTYTASTYTFAVTAGYTQTDDLDTYAIFDLPYLYYTTGDTIPSGSKMYTAKPTDSKILQTEDAPTIEIDTQYGYFFTYDGTQDSVSKVTDEVGDPNHTGNKFITAPDEIYESASATSPLYFCYWEIRDAGNRSTLLDRVFYPDFNYRSYGNYYIKPIYSDEPTDSWKTHTAEQADVDATILYLGSSRNQWNTNDSTAHTGSAGASYASDLIYNDFLLSYGYQGQTITASTSGVSELGMIIELVPTTLGGSTYAEADASSPDTSVYKSMYDSSIPTNATLQGVVTNGSSGNYIKVAGNKGNLDNKNRVEKAYSFYSQYGQNADLSFATNSSVDNYVYRAYAYIKTSSTTVISAPTYFTMRYTANRKG